MPASDSYYQQFLAKLMWWLEQEAYMMWPQLRQKYFSTHGLWIIICVLAELYFSYMGL